MVPSLGRALPRGNCTAPGVCACLCVTKGVPWTDPLRRCESPSLLSFAPSSEGSRSGPWTTPSRYRRQPIPSLPARSLPPGFTFGSGDCEEGWEGARDALGRTTTCHLGAPAAVQCSARDHLTALFAAPEIYVPEWYERYTLLLIFLGLLLFLCCLCLFFFCRGYLKERKRRKKTKMRRSRRSSEQFDKDRRSRDSGS